ncbi:hypothetical protein VTJ49DRAFT_7711 [Mycothermus thermophilus]|uniref:Transcription factor domain-containing protein n=1 Tax=Humicola insolens TaxID=85995 RepID=A0ABR3VH16_HUMIN
MSRTRKKREHRHVAQDGSPKVTSSKVTKQPQPQLQVQQHLEGCPEFGMTSDEDRSERNEPEVAIVHEIRPEVYDLFEAVAYYNYRIYPELAETELAPNRFVAPVTVVEAVSSPVLHMLVSAVISHRIIQSTEHPATDRAVKPLWRRLYHHRDVAIRGVSRILATEEGRKGFEAVSAVYTMLYTMVQQSYTPCWHIHANGFRSLLQFHGSLPDLVRKFPFIELSLIALCIINILANTTSPRDKQILLASPDETLRLINKYYTETYFPTVPCPPALLAELVRINHLRSLPPGPETATAAALCLARIEAFDPLTWCMERAAKGKQPADQNKEQPQENGTDSYIQDQQASPIQNQHRPDPTPELSPGSPELNHPPSPNPNEPWMWLNAALRPSSSPPCTTHTHASKHNPNPNHSNYNQDWLNLTTAYHAATSLYAILSLQSSGALPPTHHDPQHLSLSHLRAHHTCRLRTSLAACLASPRARRRVVWPLVVAGVEAGAAGGVDDEDTDCGGGGEVGSVSADAREGVRRWVAETLTALGREQGAAVPEVARGVLEGFWKRGGERGWEGCFEVACCLVL